MRLLIAMLLMCPTSALAAGYTCLSVDQDTKAIVYFESPLVREAKRVVFIDPTLSKKARVLAVFESAKNELNTLPSGDGVMYVSTVDDSVKNPGKHLGGTRLGLLAQVTMNVQTVPVPTLTEGTLYAAEVVYTKKNGVALAQEFDCALFLGDDAP